MVQQIKRFAFEEQPDNLVFFSEDELNFTPMDSNEKPYKLFGLETFTAAELYLLMSANPQTLIIKVIEEEQNEPNYWNMKDRKSVV